MEIIDNLDFSLPKASLIAIITGVLLIAISGMIFAGAYFFMDTIQDSLLGTNCDIENNAFFTDCQGMFALIVYPFLNLKIVLVYLSFFSIFILVIGMLLLGYQSGTSPVLMGVLVLIEILITYGAIHVANIYRLLLDNAIIRDAMIPFGVYNTLMLYFPWFVFIISLFALVLGLVNWQRSPINKSTGQLDY